MLSEHEIITQHQSSLRQARELCLTLQRNEIETRPRGLNYVELRAACERLEGSARQAAHWRGDTRWLRLGIYYSQVQKRIRKSFVQQRWMDFGKFALIFEKGLRTLDDLATRKTERPGTLILPPYAMQ
jgi:hypothetical protein